MHMGEIIHKKLSENQGREKSLQRPRHRARIVKPLSVISEGTAKK
jgi:hypothetical protein